MLFAHFPDTTVEETTQSLYDRLVPGALDYYRRASYGRLTLKVDRVDRWLPTDRTSTSGDYDCSRFDTHRRYVAEIIGKVDNEVDLSDYDVVYVVGSRAPGVPNSPTLLCPAGEGVRADGREIRFAVTFGNDIRGRDWGWQTLVHETGHLFGLPDLYLYEKTNWHRASGAWDPMGLQMPGCHHLVWHKIKLGWLREDQAVVLREGSGSVDLTSVETADGTKAVVLPIGAHEAYVVEARRHGVGDDDPLGLLLYRVSSETARGEGPIRVLPARPDDGNPAWKRLFEVLYSALWFDGTVLDDTEHRAKVVIERRTDEGFRVRVER
ncbi:MAG: hypothetical protein HZB16_21810 [Armatimonadetes bacterium]|nr:hypothetical protein [Armatimonadota bacterium]